MKTLSISGALLTAMFALATAGVYAAEPFSLAGRTLGVPYQSVLNDPAFDCGSQAGCFLYSACAYTGTETTAFKGALIEGLMLYFTGERLSAIEANFPEGGFDRVVAALTEQYGAGVQEARKPSVGQSADNTTYYVWRQGSQVLRIERAIHPGRSSVIVSEKNFLSELLER